MSVAAPIPVEEEVVESPDSVDEGAAPPVEQASPEKEARKPVNREGEEEEKKEEELSGKIFNSVVLQGINKITAQRQTIEAPLGTLMHFGNLEIVALNCWQSPEEERPENAAMLEIWEIKPDERPERVFLGWMYSSSPALSALEHPVYDISVLHCGSQEGK